MARSGRSYPNRPRLARHPRNWDRSVVLGPFETVSEWPEVLVETPNANLFLSAFETVSEWPDPTLAYDQNLILAPFETLSEWPDPGASVPIRPGDALTGSYQIEYNGFLLGGYGNQYQIIAGSVEGWDDLPGLDSSNVARPSWHGSWPGRFYSQERQVTATIAVNVGDDGDFAGAVGQVRHLLTPPAGETGAPLVIATRDEVLMVPEAVVDSRAMPTGSYHVGWVPVAVRWVCADPRRYNVIRSGFDIPAGGTVTLENAGNVASHPLLRVDGPVVNPSITNATLDRTLAFLITLADGERMEIDTDAGNATVAGVSVLSALTGASAPVSDFVLERGSNDLTYTPDDGGAAGVVALYRDAWL